MMAWLSNRWSWVKRMLVSVGVLALRVGLCRLYESNRENTWLRGLGPVAVVLGLGDRSIGAEALYLPDAAHLAEQGAPAGWQPGVQVALDEAHDGVAPNGGGAPP
jgi:hypothetical protein